MTELVVDALDHLLGERVAELVGALVRLRAGVAHEVGQEPLDDPVLADDPLGALAAGLREQCLLALAALFLPGPPGAGPSAPARPAPRVAPAQPPGQARGPTRPSRPLTRPLRAK